MRIESNKEQKISYIKNLSEFIVNESKHFLHQSLSQVSFVYYFFMVNEFSYCGLC